MTTRRRLVSGEVATDAMGCSRRSLEKLVQSGRVQSRAVSNACAPNGRPLRQYYVDSLGLKAGVKLLQQPQGELETSGGERGKIAFASKEEEQEARERLAIIEPLLNFSSAAAESAELPLLLPDGREVRSATTMCEYLAGCHQLSKRTIQRWVHLFRKGIPERGIPPGILALADSTRIDKGCSHFFGQYPKAAAVAAELYLNQRKLSVRSIYRLLQANCSQIGVPESDLPTYETVRAWLNDKQKKMAIGEFEITPAMRIMARDGLRAYESRVSPFVRRGYVDIYANQVWCSDHGIRDVRVWNDVFHDVPYGSPLRLRLTGIADLRSRKILGFTFCPEGSSMSIVTAMRGPLMQHGPPETLYIDNGEDYKKVGREICPLIGISSQRCLPYHGQSKPIERFWRTLKEDFDILFTGYTAGKPELRPDETIVEEARHQKLMRMDMVEQSGLRPASYYIGLAVVWMDEFNNHHSHSGEGMNGRTPNEVFALYPNPNQRAPFTTRELVWTLAERRPCKIYDCSIRLKKIRYVGVDEANVARLHDMAEQNVVVAYDPNAPESAAVLTLGGELLCWVRPERLLPHSSEAREDVKEIVSQRTRLRNGTQEQIQQVRHLAASTGALSGLEILERKAAQVLPMAVGEFVTQRKPRIRPDDDAVAPPSPEDLAAIVMAIKD